MTNIEILKIAFVLYVIGNFLAFYTKNKIIHVANGLLWFIPIFLVENTFIIIFSIIMILFSVLLAFYDNESKGGFE